ncbi:MAG: mechanosensitive ion channel [Verrucomicrobia bacterium]|nr:mechanosensitive ion channel [Verrucomicrobiota bacterium]
MLNLSWSPILAQAASPVSPDPASPDRVSLATRGLANRFEEATGLPGELAMWTVNIGLAILIVLAGYVFAGLVRNAIKGLLARRKIDATVGDFLGNLGHAGVMAFVIVTALEKLGIDTKTFAAVIAACGLAIGLALQGGLSNFAAGFLIIVFRPFRKDDVVLAAGVEGVVEEVQIFSTTLHTPDNKKIIIPNSSIMGGIITNYTANPLRRAELVMSVGAGHDLNHAHEVLLALAKSDPRVLQNPAPEVVNVKLVEGGTQVQLNAWCRTPDHGALMSSLISRAPGAFASAGIRGPDKSVVFVERK